MTYFARVVGATVILAVTVGGVVRISKSDERDKLLEVREQVLRTWFAGDTKTLEELVPAETIVISAGEPEWKEQTDVLRTSAEFHAKGGKLTRLEFPKTKIQRFGDVAIVWSSYSLDIEMDGKKSTDAGRVTEIFVWQHGRWANPGWHTDEEKSE